MTRPLGLIYQLNEVHQTRFLLFIQTQFPCSVLTQDNECHFIIFFQDLPGPQMAFSPITVIRRVANMTLLLYQQPAACPFSATVIVLHKAHPYSYCSCSAEATYQHAWSYIENKPMPTCHYTD